MKRNVIVQDGLPWVLGSLLLPGAVAALCFGLGHAVMAVSFCGLALMGLLFMLYFFRDPERETPTDGTLVVSGADGVIRAVEPMFEKNFLKTDTIRISIFLSPFNVHINRAPIAGTVKALAYTPGRHLLTLRNKASEVNEHSSILIEGEQTRCLVKQIVGPVVRRVVYWLSDGQVLTKGERIGMMKFGSRMDVYLPKTDVAISVNVGDNVFAGITVLAKLRKG
jgi:phosphatidylserine decarboxylase